MIEWHPDYSAVYSSRCAAIKRFREDSDSIIYAKDYYKTRPIEFIEHWLSTYEPRNAGNKDLMTTMPLILFPKQKELVIFLMEMVENNADGLIEKSRDMGATWVCCAFSVWMWLFVDESAIGWGSRKRELVDKIGDPDSIFQKMRMLITQLPTWFLPTGFNAKEHLTFMRILNPENKSLITGESGDNIGRGGRKTIYFKDESAHYERPELIEAALGDNTQTQIDISSVNGLNTPFHRKRESGSEWTNGNVVDDAVNVFIMDWSDHPLKSQEWYDKRKKKAEDSGLIHLFYQEVDRDYSAAIIGVIIPQVWVKAAVDAHKKLGFSETGHWVAGMDVADGGRDKNALAVRRGSVLLELDQWTGVDTGQSARRAVNMCRNRDGDILVEYDCIGVGAGVKAEINRLDDEGILPESVKFFPWNAGSRPFDYNYRVVENDVDSPLNKDFYRNLKAQGWWCLRRRFEKTHRAITNGDVYDESELISLPSDLPNLHTLMKELSQPTHSTTSNLSMIVDKTPEGTTSPNLADAVVMCYHANKNHQVTITYNELLR